MDSEGKLTAQHDAATANWGGDWRMPTKTEMQELINCTWTWTTQNGVNGYNVEGPNGNSIFLPAAGYYYGSSLRHTGSNGFYWSSSPDGSDSYYAYAFCFNSSDHYVSNDSRSYGQSVRPVSGGNNAEPEEPTEPETPDYNGYEYVDLGLPSGLLWATCNVGANSPEEYGDYFAWGETSTKAEYNTSNSATYGLYISQLQSQGYVDGEGNLTPQYDAATANWGGDWRMPTRNELSELRDNCTWTWTTQNGVWGRKVTSKTNGNYIFLPVAGYRGGSLLRDAGSDGYYWSSTPRNSDNAASGLVFDIDTPNNEIIGIRDLGFTVRPVLE